MNKKTFAVAFLFLCATLAWFVRLLWIGRSVYDLIISSLFILAAAGMVYNEAKKKKRRHVAERKERENVR